MKLGYLCAALAACVLCLPVKAQLFGTNTGTFVDYLYSAADQSVNFRVPGQVGAGYNPLYTGSPNVVMTQNYGLWSTASNYANGVYQISFDAPNPAAVNVAVGGMFNGLSNVQVSGTHYTANFNLFHDGGNLLAGGGEVDLSAGVSAANPVSNFAVTPLGTNKRDLTPLFTGYAGKYQAVRWMNNSNINNVTADLTAKDLLPPGQNLGTFGNSYADQARWTGQIPNDSMLWTNIPVGADASFAKGMADQIAANLPAGKKVRIEYGNEQFNFIFTHIGKVYSLAQADPRVPKIDTFTMVAMESGLRLMDLGAAFRQEWQADGRSLNDIDLFVGGQGANTYFANTAVETVKANHGGTLAGTGIKSRGISFYPGDNLSGVGSVNDLVTALYADLPRQEQYLRDEVAAAKSEGLTPGIYEWGMNGYLTKGGVPLSVINAFRADPRSQKWVADEWGAISAILGPVPDSFAMEFTANGDYWTPQIDPRAPHEPEQVAIDQISSGILVPEPSAIFPMLVLLLVFGVRRRRSIRSLVANGHGQSALN